MFSQDNPVTGVGHILAGSFLISEVPFVSQLAFECCGAEPWEHFKSKEGFELQTQPLIKLTLYKTWEKPERFPKMNCTNQTACGWGSFCCADALWIHKYHGKDGVWATANECKHEYKHWEILLVFKNKQKPEWNRKTLLSLHRTCLDRLPNPCLQQLPVGVWCQPLFIIPLRGGSSDTLPVFNDSLSATTTHWQVSARGKTEGPFPFPSICCLGDLVHSPFFGPCWMLTLLFSIGYYSFVLAFFFPPSCYYDYPLG